MPLWARLIATLVGLPILAGGVVILCIVRALDWQTLTAIIVAVVSGGGLVFAAAIGEWWPADV